MSGQHATLAPSASDKWLMCPGYVRAVADLPNETSYPAAEGTAAHWVSQVCLELGLSPYDFVGQTLRVDGFVFEWAEIDAELLERGIEAFRAHGGDFHSELRVDLSRWLGEGQFGTLDRSTITDQAIVINDLKWGRVPVSPIRNPQLGLYALGFWWQVARHKTDIRNFRIEVDQPRAAGGGGAWEVTLDELLAFGESAAQAAAASRDPDAPLQAGGWCRYCPVSKQPGGCVAFDRFNLRLLGVDPDSGEAPTVLEEMLDPRRRSYLLLHRPMLKKWLDRLEEDALAEALDGGNVPYLKPVMGRRPPRSWRDEKQARTTLVDELGAAEVMETTLKSPAKIEKDLGRTEFAERFGSLVDLGHAKPALVPVEDARPALQNYANLLDNISD